MLRFTNNGRQHHDSRHVGGANVTWDVLLLISTGEKMAVAYALSDKKFFASFA